MKRTEIENDEDIYISLKGNQTKTQLDLESALYLINNEIEEGIEEEQRKGSCWVADKINSSNSN